MGRLIWEVPMELFYQRVNITRDAIVSSARCRDVSGGRCDSLDLVLDQAAAWHRWRPEPNDRIEIVHEGYSTGEMYVNTIVPEDGKYRILATAHRTEASRKARQSFEGKTLEDIVKICAAECGMEYRIFGIDGRFRYPYLLRQNEGCAAFLNRLAQMEGAVLKTYSGRFTMIGILAAQKIPASETIHLSAKQVDSAYQRRASKYKSLAVKTPYADVSATDSAVTQGSDCVICGLPAADVVTAGRWARGLLLENNRKAEKLMIGTSFHGAWSAMVRIDVAGDTEANGEWLIDEVRHDFIDNTSRAVLLRCTEGVN